jgi:cellulose biosynthesis protein BcsQ
MMLRKPKRATMKKIALFNHKGGVGKTTLTINIADALSDLGKRVLIVDADPQCNVTAFYLDEKQLDDLLGESADEQIKGDTIWSAVKPVVRGKGTVEPIKLFQVGTNVFLAPGDVLLSEYEEELPSGWTDSFARKERGYDLTCALSDAVEMLAASVEADLVMYDVGPNVGALNRVVLLDCDYFATPVAADLFSLRALTTVGRSVAKWVVDWQTVRSLATGAAANRLLAGKPRYLGYVASAFKVASGQRKAKPHSFWEAKIAPRVARRVVDVLLTADSSLILQGQSNKLGDVKHFHSLAPSAQDAGVAIGKLRGHVNSGHYPQVDEALTEFGQLAREIIKRTGI